ncbi:MAG: HvfC/BufC N-terminal domain-containing protein [Allorhizobium sp.]
MAQRAAMQREADMTPAFQQYFTAALADLSKPVPQGLTTWTGDRPQRRFGVYRNNVRAGLAAALASRFPATERIVGADFFTAMAQDYVAAHPPRSPLLLAYGDDFADFVEAFEPAAGLAYLPDVIRLESARGHAYHSADAEPLDAGRLAAVPPEQLADLRFMPHPSLSVLRSAHPMVTIWAMNAGEAELAPIAEWKGEDALVVRPKMTVEVHRLPPGAATFFSALAGGQTLAGAAERAVDEEPAFDLAANLAGLITTGAFTDLVFPEET